MTRINMGIPVAELKYNHLVAEHREIIRIPNAITSGKAVIDNIPDTFRMGTGHVKFFYDKCGYLYNRYIQLYEEGVKRGINFTDYRQVFDDVPQHLMKPYSPKPHEIELVAERIRG